MLFIAGTPGRLLGLVAVTGLGLAIASIWSAPYRRQRFFAFLDPGTHASAASWQPVQGRIHFAAGGWSGSGIGAGTGKNSFVPEAHTDMIFSVIGEETGLIGSVLVIAAFAIFTWAGFRIAMRARDRFQQILAAGATALIAGQAAINVGAVVGILPLTGVPLPLISYGSSSKVVMLLIVGVLLSICRDGKVPGERTRSVPDDAARAVRDDVGAARARRAPKAPSGVAAARARGRSR
jgi:cell division protein FtsW